MNPFTKFFRSLVNMKDHVDVRAAAVSIRNGISFRGPNIFILICAIIIASVGLNLNSIPVIIGAMLISPVMGPILGFGLGLGTNDTALVKDALKNFAVMVVISILASSLFYLISPLELEEQTELLARTNPTLYDVLIALFGGFAGILEIARREKTGTVIPGVAIATALMPPLCTVGYGISHLEPRFIIGAFYLFLINSAFITLATVVTVKYLHFPVTPGIDEIRTRRSARWSAVIIIALIVPSVLSGIQMIQDNDFLRKSQLLVMENKNIGKSYIYDYKAEVESTPETLDLYVAGEKLGPVEREHLYVQAENLGITRSQIRIHDEATYQNEALTESEIIQGIIERHDTEVKLLEKQVQDLNLEISQYKAQQIPAALLTRELAAQYAGVQDVTLTRGERIAAGQDEGKDVIVAIIHCDKPLSEQERLRIERWLQVRLAIEDVSVIIKK